MKGTAKITSKDGHTEIYEVGQYLKMAGETEFTDLE